MVHAHGRSPTAAALYAKCTFRYDGEDSSKFTDQCVVPQGGGNSAATFLRKANDREQQTLRLHFRRRQ